jgi:hypothetical protein
MRQCVGEKSKKFLELMIPGTTGIQIFGDYRPFSHRRSQVFNQILTCVKKLLAGITSLIVFRGSLIEKGFHGSNALDSQAHPYIAMRFCFH